VGTTASIFTTANQSKANLAPAKSTKLAGIRKKVNFRNWSKIPGGILLKRKMDASEARQNLLATKWQKPSELAPRLELGDLVEFNRGRYQHWGIYIGLQNGIQCIAHISTDQGDFDGVSNKKELTSKIIHGSTAEVRSDPFFVVAGQDLCRVNNYLDDSRSPFPPRIIVDRALHKLGSGGYNLLQNNCEHFAKWCRYGSRESEQARVYQTAMIGVSALAITGSLPVSLGITTVGWGCMKYIPVLYQSIVMRSFI
jgi:HRAS-like suppressor 3